MFKGDFRRREGISGSCDHKAVAGALFLMKHRNMSVLIINGSLKSKSGNSHRVIRKISELLGTQATVVNLADFKWTPSSQKKMAIQLAKAEGVFFITGTYWDSWGSPLQIFLENITDLEGRSEILGKPAAVCVLNHSVGGKGVLSRLQGVLSTLGFMIPPMSGWVYSWVNHQVLSQNKNVKLKDDLWSLDDLGAIVENFKVALALKGSWKSWPVDRKNFRKVWLK